MGAIPGAPDGCKPPVLPLVSKQYETKNGSPLLEEIDNVMVSLNTCTNQNMLAHRKMENMLDTSLLVVPLWLGICLWQLHCKQHWQRELCQTISNNTKCEAKGEERDAGCGITEEALFLNWGGENFWCIFLLFVQFSGLLDWKVRWERRHAHAFHVHCKDSYQCLCSWDQRVGLILLPSIYQCFWGRTCEVVVCDYQRWYSGLYKWSMVAMMSTFPRQWLTQGFCK